MSKTENVGIDVVQQRVNLYAILNIGIWIKIYINLDDHT